MWLKREYRDAQGWKSALPESSGASNAGESSWAAKLKHAAGRSGSYLKHVLKRALSRKPVHTEVVIKRQYPCNATLFIERAETCVGEVHRHIAKRVIALIVAASAALPGWEISATPAAQARSIHVSAASGRALS